MNIIANRKSVIYVVMQLYEEVMVQKKLGAALSKERAVCMHKMCHAVTAMLTIKAMLAACMTTIGVT